MSQVNLADLVGRSLAGAQIITGIKIVEFHPTTSTPTGRVFYGRTGDDRHIIDTNKVTSGRVASVFLLMLDGAHVVEVVSNVGVLPNVTISAQSPLPATPAGTSLFKAERLSGDGRRERKKQTF